MSNTVPAAIDKVEGSESYSDNSFNDEQEWDVGAEARVKPHTTSAEQAEEPVNDTPTLAQPSQPPTVRTPISRRVQQRDYLQLPNVYDGEAT